MNARFGLEKIQISGFKSFVDPCEIYFNHNKSVIVGPNGSGKSNVIDAARWVMGESSAKGLRGEVQDDLIFKGSESRKPVSTASVSLCFVADSPQDLGRLKKISRLNIRRVLHREQRSEFFINSVSCRRADVTELLTELGLGPRSYAIIEQGAVSQLADQHQTQLRTMLEQAAGIAQYHHRRHEAELNLKRSEEDIAQVQNLRDELGKQKRKLKEQFRAAERFRSMQQRKQQLKRYERGLIIHQSQTRLVEAKEQAQSTVSRLRSARTEKDQALKRYQSQVSARDHYQQSLIEDDYQCQKWQTRAQSLQDQLEMLERTLQSSERERSRLQTLEQKLCAQISQDQEALQERKHQVLEAELNQVQQQYQQSVAEHEALERAYQHLQQRHMAYRQLQSSELQAVRAKEEKMQLLQAQLEQWQSRLEAMGEVAPTEKEPDHDTSELEASLASMNARLDGLGSSIAALSAELKTSSDSVVEQRVLCKRQQQRSDELRQSLSVQQALYDATLGLDEDHPSSAHESKVASKVRIVPKWVKAVEALLAVPLKATVFENRAQALSNEQDFACIRPSQQASPQASDSSPMEPGESLLSQVVHSPVDLRPWLSRYYCAPDLLFALENAERLSPEQCWMTPQGHLVARDWRLCVAFKTNQPGLLQQKEHIAELKRRCIEQQQCLQQALDAEKRLMEREKTVQERLQDEKQNKHRLEEVRTQMKFELEQLQQQQRLSTQLQLRQQAERTHIHEQCQRLRKAIEQSEQELKTLTQQSDQTQQVPEPEAPLRERIRQAYEEKRQLEQRLRALEIEHQSRLNAHSSIQNSLAQLQKVRQDQNQRSQELAGSIVQMSAQIRQLEQDVQQAQLRIQSIETKQQEKKRDLATLQQRCEHAESEKDRALARFEESERLSQHQTVEVEKIQTLLDHWVGMEDGIHPEKPESDLSLESLREELQRIEAKLSVTQHVNLGAEKELKEVTDRIAFYDSQVEDLTQAIADIEQAIRKMDQETHTHFQRAFHQLEEHLRRHFVQLFPQGRVWLRLAGDDWKDAGIEVLTQIRGKAHVPLHLLSGGEKTLIAISVMLALFSLNPSPFCFLDEVDATLDDVNTVRLNQALSALAQGPTRVVMISHNRLTMESAQQLLGITMAERGHSRHWAVDVDDALAYAAQ